MNPGEIKKQIWQKEQELKKQRKIKEAREALKNYKGDDRVVWFGDYYQEIKTQKKDKVFTVNSGFESLDDLLLGFRQGQLNIITGLTSQGKTLFAKNLMRNITEQKTQSLMFLFEVPAENLMRDIIDDMENDNDLDENFIHFFLPRRHQPKNVKWVEDRIVESKLKNDTKVVFIDHLDYIYTVPRGDSEERAVRETVYTLKNLAVREKLIIFLLAHVHRTQKGGERPHIWNLKYSSAIEQASDDILVIHRFPDRDEFDPKKPMTDDMGEYSYRQNLAKIYLDKNRDEGNVGNIGVKYDPILHKFIEVDDTR